MPSQAVPSNTPRRVDCLDFSPDGGTIATADESSRVRTWDPRTLAPTGEFHGHKSTGLAISYSKDGKLLASGGVDGHVFVWATDTKRIVADLAHRSEVYALAFSNDGRWLVTGSSFRDCKARLWDAATLKLVKTFTVAEVGPDGDYVQDVDHLAISPDSKLLATPGDKPGDVWIWDIEAGGRKYAFHDPVRHGINGLNFSPDGKTLAIHAHFEIMLWDFARSASRTITPDFCPAAFTFAPDGEHLIVAGATKSLVFSPGYLGIINLRDGRMVTGRTLGAHVIQSVAFAPDGDTFATGSTRGDVGLKVWSLKDLLAHPHEPPAGDAGRER